MPWRNESTTTHTRLSIFVSCEAGYGYKKETKELEAYRHLTWILTERGFLIMSKQKIPMRNVPEGA
jgi:hypothetical protein